MSGCESCTLCCKLVGVKEIAKPPGKWCPHCAPGKGCGIYQERPAMCAAFQCLWLANHESDEGRKIFTDAMRPDRCKVVFTADEEWDFAIAFTEHGAAILDRPAVKKAVDYMLYHQRAVIIARGLEEAPVLLTPRGWSKERIEDLRRRVSVGLAQDIAAFAPQAPPLIP